MSESQEFDLDAPGPTRRGVWLDYVEGTAQALRSRGLTVSGADLLIESDVPAGAGLSASAALELAVALAFTVLGGNKDTERLQLALAGQAAEHTYVGTLCGIMDQYISALGKQDHATLLDCRSLEGTYVPLELRGAEILILDTRVRHSLASSAYNQRRAECQEGVQLLSQALPGIQSLRDVSYNDFEQQAARLPEVTRARCRHVVTENARALNAAEALNKSDLQQFGRLMTASHRSLQQDYEVSCPELDMVVEMANAAQGVYGARMTGGGFGGSAVALVDREATRSLSNRLLPAYSARFGRPLGIFATRACAGASETLNS